MANILITGFTPFAGRAVNASWLAAHWLAEHHNTAHTIRAALLPVIWGAPEQILKELVNSYQPDLVISLGEGHPERFAIETRARNQRSQREDNSGKLPPAALVSEHGQDVYISALDTTTFAQRLIKKGYPAQSSDDAGAFLCEETLYCLEAIRENTRPDMRVVFCHLPPYGTSLQVANQQVHCDQPLLSAFVNDLLQALTSD
jgi:pyroglutamyl-peptidase